MSITSQYEDIIRAAGGNPDELSDRTLSSLLKCIEECVASGGASAEQIQSAVNAYLKENPVEVDAYSKTETDSMLSKYALKTSVPSVPSTLPNPNKLTFSGAVSAEYDGSAAVEVMIPQGGGGGVSAEYSLLKTVSITEAVNSIVVDLGGTYNELWLFFDKVKADVNAQLAIGVNTNNNYTNIISSANGLLTTGDKHIVVHLKRLAGANRLLREDTDHTSYGFWQSGVVNRRFADDNSNGISSLCICTSAPTTATYTAGTIKIWGC